MPCLNCGTELQGGFCHSCGQKVPRSNPSLGEFVRDATEELAHWDGKIPASLKALLLTPGRLTLDFLEGRRARWLPPLRLYLLCSVVYFLSGPTIEALTHRQAKQAIRFGITMSDTSKITPELREELENSTLTRIVGKKAVERMLGDPAGFQRSFSTSYPKAMFVLLPLFALLTRVAYGSGVRRYPAHLYFALHLHAAAFSGLALSKIFGALGSLIWEAVLGVLALGYVLWYALRSARVVFGGSVAGTAGRMILVGIGYWILILLTTITLITWMA